MPCTHCASCSGMRETEREKPGTPLKPSSAFTCSCAEAWSRRQVHRYESRSGETASVQTLFQVPFLKHCTYAANSSGLLFRPRHTRSSSYRVLGGSLGAAVRAPGEPPADAALLGVLFFFFLSALLPAAATGVLGAGSGTGTGASVVLPSAWIFFELRATMPIPSKEPPAEAPLGWLSREETRCMSARGGGEAAPLLESAPARMPPLPSALVPPVSGCCLPMRGMAFCCSRCTSCCSFRPVLLPPSRVSKVCRSPAARCSSSAAPDRPASISASASPLCACARLQRALRRSACPSAPASAPAVAASTSEASAAACSKLRSFRWARARLLAAATLPASNLSALL
mmetsp:Transcript_24194/g.53842  ORF Transcript_24194/g.53842 Transcript_24194/m.53842 type:complete len:343 (-) Transcript_24194:669-1697(-)